jgi:hypothetical protein
MLDLDIINRIIVKMCPKKLQCNKFFYMILDFFHF